MEGLLTKNLHRKQTQINTRYSENASSDSESEEKLPPTQQKIDEYADAGFYLDSGIFTCHSCNGKLLEAYNGEDPWELHALLFSKCEHLIKMKGQCYVTEILSKYTVRNVSKSEEWFHEFITQLKSVLRCYEEFVTATGKYKEELHGIKIRVGEFMRNLDQPRLKSHHFLDCEDPDNEWYPKSCGCLEYYDRAKRVMRWIIDTIGVEYITWLQLKNKLEGELDSIN